MKNYLLEALRANDKTGYLFETNSTFVAYKTGFPVLDYNMGFVVNVFNKEGELIQTYPAIGITTGSIVTIIGGSHTGKAEPVDKVIPTPDGMRRYGDLKKGDYVFNKHGKPVKILEVFPQGKRDMYKLTFDDGRVCVCGDKHLWTVFTKHDKRKVINTEDLYEWYQTARPNAHKCIDVCEAVEYPTKKYDIDPYVIGAFIGNGCNTCPALTFSSNDEETVAEIARLIDAKGYKKNPHNYNYNFILKDEKITKPGLKYYRSRIFFQKYQELLTTSGYKKIPTEYLFGDLNQRWSLVQGLFDTDGSIDINGCIGYTTTSAELANNIRFLLNGLGFKVTISKDKRTEKYKTSECFNLTINAMNNEKYKFFRLRRKRERALDVFNNSNHYNLKKHFIYKVEKLNVQKEMNCIYVDDPEHLYLTNDYITTHNTSMAIQIASNIVRPFKTGVVIHYDLEGGTNMTRVSALSRFNPSELSDKYILRQSGASIEEIKLSIAKLYKEKTSNPDLYKYDTGKLDEFGKEIYAYEPTCMIIDSVASMSTYINENTKDGMKSLEEISTQTDKMRLTAEIGRFLVESMQMLKAANIILFLINHIKEKPGMGVPQAPELRYLRQNETLNVA